MMTRIYTIVCKVQLDGCLWQLSIAQQPNSKRSPSQHNTLRRSQMQQIVLCVSHVPFTKRNESVMLNIGRSKAKQTLCTQSLKTQRHFSLDSAKKQLCHDNRSLSNINVHHTDFSAENIPPSDVIYTPNVSSYYHDNE